MQRVVNYLKEEFRILPDVQRFDSGYLKDMVAQKKSLEIDSLIMAKVHVVGYTQMKMNFIRYDNYYWYKDRKSDEYFSVYLIQDVKTGKFYTDFVRNRLLTITESYCSWSGKNNTIKADESRNISQKDAIVYNNIYTARIFGERETRLAHKQIGIENYLNDIYHFKEPSKVLLDSLFKFYDKNVFYKNDTLLNSSNELFHFMSDCVGVIKSRPHYSDRATGLVYLKDQVKFIITSNK